MSPSFLSQHWYRVGSLTPRLVARVRVSRHSCRGRGWYVLYDPAVARVHRFSAAAWAIAGRMDGVATVDALWREAVEIQGDDAPTQDDVLRLLTQLHAADLLDAALPPETAELFDRHSAQLRRQRLQRWLNPLSLRIPLLNPDRFLARTQKYVAPLLGWGGAAVWALVVLAGALLTGLHWPELTEGLLDRLLTAENLLVLWLSYPLVKAVHELAHGYASRLRDCPVYEMGVMFLVFFPVPYVDASATAALPDKRDRAFVAAAGIVVELFVAGLAMIVWSLLEPGLARSVALNVALIGGVSTVLLNGNPLLRFDGYYVLCDLIEIPNLSQRSGRFWGRLVERRLFGAAKDAGLDPQCDRRERLWLIGYGPAAYVYRLLVTLSIALLVSTMAFGLGLLIAAWALVMAILLPVLKQGDHVLRHPRLARVRTRAVTTSLVGMAAVAAGLFLLPVPMWTVAQGVVWLPEKSKVRATTSGVLAQTLAEPGADVTRQTPLFRTEEPAIATRLDLAEARLRQLEIRQRAAMLAEPLRASLLADELVAQRAIRDREVDEQNRQIVGAPLDGRFVVPRAADLGGRYVPRGQLLGYVIEPELRRLRVAVRQDAVDLVRQDLAAVQVRLLADPARSHAARVVREVPAAARRLPSAALSTRGGGQILADPDDPSGETALGSYYQFELDLASPLPWRAFGSRASVRFTHSWRPLGWQIWRRARLLVMRQLDV